MIIWGNYIINNIFVTHRYGGGAGIVQTAAGMNVLLVCRGDIEAFNQDS